jgi:hypothetical protein
VPHLFLHATHHQYMALFYSAQENNPAGTLEEGSLSAFTMHLLN